MSYSNVINEFALRLSVADLCDQVMYYVGNSGEDK